MLKPATLSGNRTMPTETMFADAQALCSVLALLGLLFIDFVAFDGRLFLAPCSRLLARILSL